MVQEKILPRSIQSGPRRYHFNNDEFLKMLEAGYFDQGPRVELIEGEIVEVDAVGPRHGYAVSQLNKRLSAFNDSVFIWVQCPLQTPDSSTPLPDIVLLEFPEEQYKTQLPQPAQALLVIEVADSSLSTDRNDKLPVYAKAGIPEYWIVNLQDNQLEIYRDPKGTDYLTRTTLQPRTLAQALCLSQPIQWD